MKRFSAFVLGLLSLAISAVAEQCPDCAKLSLAGDAKKKKPAIVYNLVDPGKGNDVVVLYDPRLPGLRKVIVDKKPSETLYQDTDSNLYEKIVFKSRRALQLLKNGGSEGVRGDLVALGPPTRRDLVSLFSRRWKELPDSQRLAAAYFLIGHAAGSVVKYCEHILKAAQAHGHPAALPPKCR